MKKLFTKKTVLLSWLLTAITGMPLMAQNNYLWSWGYTISSSSKMGPQNLTDAPGGKWISVATGDAGQEYAAGVREDGTLWTWHKNILNPNSHIPARYGTDNDWRMVTMGPRGA